MNYILIGLPTLLLLGFFGFMAAKKREIAAQQEAPANTDRAMAAINEGLKTGDFGGFWEPAHRAFVVPVGRPTPDGLANLINVLTLLGAEGPRLGLSDAQLQLVRAAYVLCERLQRGDDVLLGNRPLLESVKHLLEHRGQTPVGSAAQDALKQQLEDLSQEAAKRVPDPKQGLIVYGGSDCPATENVLEYLERHGVQAEVKYIDKSVLDRFEAHIKLHEAGLSMRGTPVMRLGGVVTRGWDEDDLAPFVAAARQA